MIENSACRTTEVSTTSGLPLAIRKMLGSAANDSRCRGDFAVVVVVALGTSFACCWQSVLERNAGENLSIYCNLPGSSVWREVSLFSVTAFRELWDLFIVLLQEGVPWHESWILPFIDKGTSNNFHWKALRRIWFYVKENPKRKILKQKYPKTEVINILSHLKKLISFFPTRWPAYS